MDVENWDGLQSGTSCNVSSPNEQLSDSLVSERERDQQQAMQQVAFPDYKNTCLFWASNAEEVVRHYKEAIKTYKDVHTFKGNNLTEEQEHTLITLKAIAYTNNKLGKLKSQDNPEEAIRHYEEALQAYKNVHTYQINNLGNEDEHTLNTLSDIAYINNKLGGFIPKTNPEEALLYYEEALNAISEVHKIQTSNLGEEHEQTLETLRGVAYTNTNIGRLKSQDNLVESLQHYEDASQIYKEVLEIQTKRLGKEHEDTTNALRDIAYNNNKLGVLKSQDNPVEALKHHGEAYQMYKEVLEIQTKTLGKEHEYTLNALRDIAYTKAKLGELKSQDNPVEGLKHYEEAFQMFNVVLGVQIRTFGKEHFKTKKTAYFSSGIKKIINILVGNIVK